MQENPSSFGDTRGINHHHPHISQEEGQDHHHHQQQQQQQQQQFYGEEEQIRNDHDDQDDEMLLLSHPQQHAPNVSGAVSTATTTTMFQRGQQQQQMMALDDPTDTTTHFSTIITHHHHHQQQQQTTTMPSSGGGDGFAPDETTHGDTCHGGVDGSKDGTTTLSKTQQQQQQEEEDGKVSIGAPSQPLATSGGDNSTNDGMDETKNAAVAGSEKKSGKKLSPKTVGSTNANTTNRIIKGSKTSTTNINNFTKPKKVCCLSFCKGSEVDGPMTRIPPIPKALPTTGPDSISTQVRETYYKKLHKRHLVLERLGLLEKFDDGMGDTTNKTNTLKQEQPPPPQQPVGTTIGEDQSQEPTITVAETTPVPPSQHGVDGLPQQVGDGSGGNAVEGSSDVSPPDNNETIATMTTQPSVPASTTTSSADTAVSSTEIAADAAVKQQQQKKKIMYDRYGNKIDGRSLRKAKDGRYCALHEKEDVTSFVTISMPDGSVYKKAFLFTGLPTKIVYPKDYHTKKYGNNPRSKKKRSRAHPPPDLSKHKNKKLKPAGIAVSSGGGGKVKKAGDDTAATGENETAKTNSSDEVKTTNDDNDGVKQEASGTTVESVSIVDRNTVPTTSTTIAGPTMNTITTPGGVEGTPLAPSTYDDDDANNNLQIRFQTQQQQQQYGQHQMYQQHQLPTTVELTDAERAILLSIPMPTLPGGHPTVLSSAVGTSDNQGMLLSSLNGLGDGTSYDGINPPNNNSDTMPVTTTLEASTSTSAQQQQSFQFGLGSNLGWGGHNPDPTSLPTTMATTAAAAGTAVPAEGKKKQRQAKVCPKVSKAGTPYSKKLCCVRFCTGKDLEGMMKRVPPHPPALPVNTKVTKQRRETYHKKLYKRQLFMEKLGLNPEDHKDFRYCASHEKKDVHKYVTIPQEDGGSYKKKFFFKDVPVKIAPGLQEQYQLKYRQKRYHGNNSNNNNIDGSNSANISTHNDHNENVNLNLNNPEEIDRKAEQHQQLQPPQQQQYNPDTHHHLMDPNGGIVAIGMGNPNSSDQHGGSGNLDPSSAAVAVGHEGAMMPLLGRGVPQGFTQGEADTVLAMFAL